MKHMRPKTCLAALAAAALAAAPLAAQKPGHYVGPLGGLAGSQILSVDPATGAISTITTVPFAVAALTMAPNNVDFAVLGSAGGTGFVATVTPGGTVTTVNTLPSSYIFENLAYDQDGSYLVPIGAGKIQIARVAGGVTTIIDPTPAIGGGKPRGIAVETGSGDYMVGEIPSLYRVRPDGTSATVNTNVAINNSIDMWSDPRTGGTIVSQQNNLANIDPVTGVMTTINATPFSGCFPGLAFDRGRDEFVLAGHCARANAYVYRVARTGAVVTVAGNPGFADIEVYGSRNVAATTNPTPGSALVLNLSEPGSPSASYFAAASFSTSPGLVLPIGTVDLTPDPLFFLSIAAPTIFQNFQGALDTGGTAVATVNLPPIPALQGVRFFVSFVTFSGSTLQAIANTQGFTIR